ncbi:MAG: beta-propeller fold lactonase family protein [Xanthomonadales bacterium]|nr:beta-propeller fold lactonase family protein [Xanthomonadales bacterium]
MNRHIARVTLGLLAIAASSTAPAKLQAPDHVIYGNATLFGVDAPLGSVIELREPDGDVLARYELGRDSRLGRQYALYIPMDTVDPREDGHARNGDEVEVFIGPQLAARTQVGDEGVAVRLDIDPQNMGTGPAIRVDPIQIMEGNSGTTVAPFVLKMNTTAPDRTVQIDWQTAAQTATGGGGCASGIDFINASGVASIPAGQLQTTVNVTVCGDGTIEPNETFELQLTGTHGDFGVIQDSSVQATILDDDDLPSVRVANVRVLEPETGSAPASFEVSLSRSSAVDVSFDYATSNGTATAGLDFTASSASLTIPAGDTSASIHIAVLADATVEPQETFRLQLSNPQAAGLENSFATASIVDPAYDPALIDEDETNSDDDAGGQLVQPGAIAVTADGRYAYATSEAMDSLLLFSRDAQSGRLTYITSYSASGVGAPLDGVRDVVLSPDDKHVYAASRADNAVVAFSRDGMTGELTLVGSVQQGVSGATGLTGSTALAISPDGRSLYAVGSTDSSLAVLARDTGSGALSFVEAEVNGADDVADTGASVANMDRPSAVVVAPDGKQVYVSASFGNAVVVFGRTDAQGSTDDGKLSFITSHSDGLLGVDGLSGASDLLITPDGTQLYASGEAEDAVVLFNRASDGSLTWQKAWRRGTAGVVGMDGPRALSLSPDGKEIYVTGWNDNSLTVFARTVASGNPSNPVGSLITRQTLFDDEGAIASMAGPVALACSADGRNVYVVANTDNAIVVLHRTAFDGIFDSGFE